MQCRGNVEQTNFPLPLPLQVELNRALAEKTEHSMLSHAWMGLRTQRVSQQWHQQHMDQQKQQLHQQAETGLAGLHDTEAVTNAAVAASSGGGASPMQLTP